MAVRSLFRLLTIACLLGLLLPEPAHAQAERDTTRRPPALQQGGWGLQYQMTSLNALLSGFQGSLISARYHLSNRQALRFGVSINASSFDREEGTTVRFDDDATAEPVSEQSAETGSQRFGLSGQYLHYLEPAPRVFAFVGVGPQFSYSKSSDETTTIPDPDSEDFREESSTEGTVYSVGVGGTLGVEWFVHPNVSLSAEYPLSFDYIDRHNENTKLSIEAGDVAEEQTTTIDTNRFRVGGGSVRIGLTFSFGP
jgi:opacity protein-like surface antigen